MARPKKIEGIDGSVLNAEEADVKPQEDQGISNPGDAGRARTGTRSDPQTY